LHLSDYAPSGTNRSIGTRAQRSLGGHQRAPRRAADVALCSSCRPSHVYNGARRTFTMLHLARLEWSTLHVGTAGRRQSAVLLPRARARAHAHAALRAPVGSGSDHLPRLSAWLAPPAPAPATGLGPPRPTSGPGLALQGTTRGRRTSSGSRRTAASRRTRAGPRARRRVSTRVPRASFPARRALERPSHRPRLARFHPSLARSRKEEHRLRWFGIAAAEWNRSQDISACNATQLALVETAHAQWLGKLAPLTDPVRLYDRTGGPTGINGNGYGFRNLGTCRRAQGTDVPNNGTANRT
jgi:hypothetical protein